MLCINKFSFFQKLILLIEIPALLINALVLLQMGAVILTLTLLISFAFIFAFEFPLSNKRQLTSSESFIVSATLFSSIT